MCTLKFISLEQCIYTIPSFCRDSPTIIVAMLFRFQYPKITNLSTYNKFSFSSSSTWVEVKMNFSIVMQRKSSRECIWVRYIGDDADMLSMLGISHNSMELLIFSISHLKLKLKAMMMITTGESIYRLVSYALYT